MHPWPTFVMAPLLSLKQRREESCVKFMQKASKSKPLKCLIPSVPARVPHYNLRAPLNTSPLSGGQNDLVTL